MINENSNYRSNILVLNNYFSYIKNKINPEISALAKEIFAETAIVASYVVLATIYTTPMGSLGFLAMGTTNVIVNIAFRQLKSEIDTSGEVVKNPSRVSQLKKGLDVISALSFSLIDLSVRSTLFHELGHAFAAHLVFLNPKTSITLTFLSGGETHISKVYSLTNFGAKLGQAGSWALISAAGTAFSVGLACLDLTAAHSFRKTHPKLSLYLNVTAIVSIANSVLYALSTYMMTMPGHDFESLMKFGISPLQATTGIIAVPLFFKIMLIAFDYLKHQDQTLARMEIKKGNESN